MIPIVVMRGRTEPTGITAGKYTCLKSKFIPPSRHVLQENVLTLKNRKWHAFHGNLYALFLMEIMEDALFDLARGLDKYSFEEELSRMKAKEVENMIKFEDGSKQFRFIK